MNKITLYDVLKVSDQDAEMTVYDDIYDIETYFYASILSEDDIWDASMVKLSKLLNVTKIHYGIGVEVSLSKLIESKIDEINNAKLFDSEMDIDYIMEEIDGILSGNVSEKWFVEFVDILGGAKK